LRLADGGDPLLAGLDLLDRAIAVMNALRDSGVIDKSDVVQSTSNPDDLFKRMLLPSGAEDLREAIQDMCMNNQIRVLVKPKKNLIANKLKKDVIESDVFKALWEKISPRTTYHLVFDTPKFIEQVIYRLRAMERIYAPRITIRTGEAIIKQKGVGGALLARKDVDIDMRGRASQDILAYLQAETDLTRASLLNILIGSKRLGDFFINPQVFLDRVADAIQLEMGKLYLDEWRISKKARGVKYSKLIMDGKTASWDVAEFSKEDQVDKDSSVEVKKSIYERVVVDSTIERNFAKAMDEREDVVLFVKLPWWYKIDTPVGKYNPDWAIALRDGDVFYIVRETKGTTNLDKLRFNPEEKAKIYSGMAHFDELGVSYQVVRAADQVTASR